MMSSRQIIVIAFAGSVLGIVLSSFGLPAVAIFYSVCGLTLLTGHFGLPVIRSLGLRQTVRDDGPETHYVKSGTPTFGGFFFLIPLLILMIAGPFVLGDEAKPVSALILLVLLFSGVGFLDDFVKVRVSKEGLTVRQKTVSLSLISLLFSVYYVFFSPIKPFLLIPFSRQIVVIDGFWRFPYAVFIVVFLFYVSNSVNITDGLDGLLASLMTITGFFLAVYASVLRDTLPFYLSSIWFNVAVAAGCLGFLAYNRHPARVFMGDTGSQALGAGLAGVTLLMGMPWMLLIQGFVFVFEGLSVTLQFLYFRHTGGKRIFRMAPIHHHFELGGWKETKIVAVFCLVTFLLGLVGLLFVVRF
jgi:phospho-N-acetylmuramoyl-pentapeptide-transferase